MSLLDRLIWGQRAERIEGFPETSPSSPPPPPNPPLYLDRVTLREVLGDHPAPEAVRTLQNEVAAALARLQAEILSGWIAKTPSLVRGVPLALWLPLEEVARLLAGAPPRRRKEGNR